jgi:hypothetical protein
MNSICTAMANLGEHKQVPYEQHCTSMANLLECEMLREVIVRRE